MYLSKRSTFGYIQLKDESSPLKKIMKFGFESQGKMAFSRLSLPVSHEEVIQKSNTVGFCSTFRPVFHLTTNSKEGQKVEDSSSEVHILIQEEDEKW
jgi:hypothetical protein